MVQSSNAIIFSLCIFILSGCVTGVEEPKDVPFECPESYMVFGNECCLGANNNQICDKDEPYLEINDSTKDSDNSILGRGCVDGESKCNPLDEKMRECIDGAWVKTDSYCSP